MNPRSLPGMTMGARKRAARRDSRLTFDQQASYLAERARYRIGERPRPCPGCHICAVDPVQAKRLPRGYRVIFLYNEGYYATTKTRRGVAAWSVVPDGTGWRHASDFARALVCFKGSELVTIADVGPRACDGSGVLPARRAKP